MELDSNKNLDVNNYLETSIDINKIKQLENIIIENEKKMLENSIPELIEKVSEISSLINRQVYDQFMDSMEKSSEKVNKQLNDLNIYKNKINEANDSINKMIKITDKIFEYQNNIIVHSVICP